MANARMNYVYIFCRDVDQMRAFYSEALGLAESNYRNEEEWGWVCYKMNGFEFMIFRDDSGMKPNEEFSWLPGGSGGEALFPCWTVTAAGEDEFRKGLAVIREKGYRTRDEKPGWFQDSYWAIAVLDPMGNTIEFAWQPDVVPESKEWND